MSYFAFPSMDYTLSWSTQEIHTAERTTEKSKTDKNIAARDCHKCVYEIECHRNPIGCMSYKKDAPDGGYYG